MTAAVILPDALLARFRAVAFERLERVDATWVALTHGSAPPNAEEQLFRELHTLKGDARVVGFADVAVLCQRLEDLLTAARQRRYRVHEDVDIVVTMAIQFVGMLLRKRSGVARSGIDLDGFIAQIEQVLSEWLRRSSEAPDGAVQMRPQLSFDEPEGSPAAARARLSVVATTVYLEHLRASGRSRARLREVWDVLSREIVDFEALPVAPLIARHTAASAELARELGKSVAIVADAGDLRVTKEVFNVLSTAILHGIRNAIDHGLELSAARERAGKPRLPTLRVSLHPRDDLLELEVADDGAGIDFEAVREVAARRGLAPAQWLGVAGPSELAEMLSTQCGPRQSDWAARRSSRARPASAPA
jgi:two-component system chemotaxis sensor kinase CheA